jgi:2-aminoethylphosphonate-pyruvate transaminase
MIQAGSMKKLFSPGPVLTTDRVKRAMLAPDLCHRARTFEHVLNGLRQKIVRLYNGGDEYTSVVITGSGTAANEAVLSSVLAPTEEVLILSNGEFGQRLADIASIYHQPSHILDFGWAKPMDVDRVEEALEDYPRTTLVAMVFHETSTGMVNPVGEVASLVRRLGRLIFVDAISAIGGEEFWIGKQGVDFSTGVPNKAVGGIPGLSFVCFKREHSVRSRIAPQRNEYLNLFRHLEIADERNQTPHTPAVPLFLALDEALEELFEEGLQNRIARYSRCSALLRTGVRGIPLDILVPDTLASTTVTSVLLPAWASLGKVIEALDKEGYVVYPGKGPLLSRNVVQIANMGNISESDCAEFLQAFRGVLSGVRRSQSCSEV